MRRPVLFERFENIFSGEKKKTKMLTLPSPRYNEYNENNDKRPKTINLNGIKTNIVSVVSRDSSCRQSQVGVGRPCVRPVSARGIRPVVIVIAVVIVLPLLSTNPIR